MAPCKNLIIYCVFITKTPFGIGRVPNETLTCIHGASETTFCACFSPLWRPRGAPGLKTELPGGPRPPKNHLKIHRNHTRIHFGLQCSVSGCPGVRPPTKNDPKLTQNGCKCITFGASSLGLFGPTFPSNIVMGTKTLKHAVHAKHHRMSVDCLSGHLDMDHAPTFQKHGGGLGACAFRLIVIPVLSRWRCEWQFTSESGRTWTSTDGG